MNKKKVLVVDDEQIVLDSVRRILSAENFEVETTLNGQEGIRRAQNNTYDLVLSDVRMPDISGKIVLREVKRAKPLLPVVIISGYATVQSAIQCMRLGASHVLEKPFTPEELIQVVNSALDKSDRVNPDEQGLIHEEEIRKILNRATRNPQFAQEIIDKEALALEEYNLTATEKLALLTGDVAWFEQYMGELEPKHKKFFGLMA
ncbi:MAG: response regulator [Desulfobacteraceae bacterium]|nr:response regulator [Desulfobacteraceae bacterium]